MEYTQPIRHEKLKSLKYYIFSGRGCSDAPCNDVYNASYNMWKDVWKSEFEKLNCDTSGLANDFTRQDLIVALAKGTEIAGVHLYSIFNLNSQPCLDHNYITDNYPIEFIDSLKRVGVNHAMSWEYLTVSPAWRRSEIGLSLGKIMVNIAGLVLKSTIAECSIAPARNDYKVSQMVYDIGGEAIFANVTNHNVNCDLLACFKNKFKNHDDPTISHYANHFWSERIDSQVNIWLGTTDKPQVIETAA